MIRIVAFTVALLLLTVCSASLAQTDSLPDENRLFVVLNSGKVVYCDELMLQNKKFLLDDEVEIPVSSVRLYHSNKGVFGYAVVDTWGQRMLTKRTETGNINLFDATWVTIVSPGGLHIEKYQYFNQGVGRLRKVQYRSLRPILANDAAASTLLQKYHRQRTGGVALKTVGMLAFTTGLATLLLSEFGNLRMSDDQAFVFGASTAIPGMLAFYIGMGVKLGSTKHLSSAIHVYNR